MTNDQADELLRLLAALVKAQEEIASELARFNKAAIDHKNNFSVVTYTDQ